VSQSQFWPLFLPKLPWPESKPVLDSLARSPLLFAQAAVESGRANPQVAEHLLQPQRVRAAVELASGEDLKMALLSFLANSPTDEKGGLVIDRCPSALKQ